MDVNPQHPRVKYAGYSTEMPAQKSYPKQQRIEPKGLSIPPQQWLTQEEGRSTSIKQVDVRPAQRERVFNTTPQGSAFRETKASSRDEYGICKELQAIGETLVLCQNELGSKNTRIAIQDVNKTSVTQSTDEAVAFKVLLQKLDVAIDQLGVILPSCSEMVQNEADIDTEPTLFSHGVTDDFVHVHGPMTENMVVNILQDRFNAQCYHTNVGQPVLVSVNPFGLTEKEDDIQQEAKSSVLLRTFLNHTLHALFQTGISQLMILSGESCSGKSFASQVLVHQLLDETSGLHTDLAKQLLSSITVLRSLGKARTRNNPDSSRVAKLYEFHFSNRIISKTKIQCYPLDMSRIVRAKEGERNFHIFYQLFSGLNPKDRAKLQLQTHNANELRYLYNYPVDEQSEIDNLRKEFQQWKLALSVLGIPFSDVSRVLAAILLLGNVQFAEKSLNVLDVQGGDFELKSVAVLLGVPYTSLFRSLTKRTKVVQGEIVAQSCHAAQANCSRDALAKALYSRTLSAILRRCNSSRKPVASQESSPNSSTESLSKTSPVSSHEGFLNISGNSPVNAGDSATILGIADLFGFESSKCNGMEQICCNLSSETIQHFYSAHIFKSAERYCSEEEIANEVDVDYVDNSECVELLTSQPTGILSYLDQETLNIHFGSPATFMEKLHQKHSGRSKFKLDLKKLQFSIVHHNSEVVYDAKDVFLSNDDSIVDDVIRTFSKENCSFGFITHLFANDLKLTFSHARSDGEVFLHKISQNINDTKPSALTNPGVQSLSQDFQGKLDALLEKIVRCQPWFVLCLKSNAQRTKGLFDPHAVSRQVKSLQIFETIYLLRLGYTHRMRFIPFAQRYFAMQDNKLTQQDAIDIARSYHSLVSNEQKENPNKLFYVGKKHVLFSEVIWQMLEKDRREKEESYARRTRIVEDEMVFSPRRELRYDESPTILMEDVTETSRISSERLNTSTITTPPPPIPKRRSYTVIDNKKIRFPQIRIMTHNYRDIDSGREVVFNHGETVQVLGASPRSGFLTVQSQNKTGCVPYNMTALLSENH